MREFSSAQIKKGVRSIGLGGDGATWGNYSLVWKDAGVALADYGDTSYSNGNDFHFSAVGLTTPSFWHGLAFYVIVMSEGTNDVQFDAKAPGLGAARVALVGSGSDHAVFTKIALPLGSGFSAGVMLAHETSEFHARVESVPQQFVNYETRWRPSGGLGVTWQPNKTVLIGMRALFNSDLERRTTAVGMRGGLARTAELRLGGSVSPWTGALLDAGLTRLEKRNELAASHTVAYHPNVGFEQALLERRIFFRFGLDETSPTVGLSFKRAPLSLDVVYVSDMGHSRVGDLFGTSSRSLILTLSLDYRALVSGSR